VQTAIPSRDALPKETATEDEKRFSQIERTAKRQISYFLFIVASEKLKSCDSHTGGVRSISPPPAFTPPSLLVIGSIRRAIRGYNLTCSHETERLVYAVTLVSHSPN
jgi:hypothetical protein